MSTPTSTKPRRGSTENPVTQACGCINQLGGGIIYCSLHAQAPAMMEALKAQHEAIDRLFARLIQLDSTFMPSQSGQPWAACLQANAILAQIAQGWAVDAPLKQVSIEEERAACMKIVESYRWTQEYAFPEDVTAIHMTNRILDSIIQRIRQRGEQYGPAS